MKRFCVLLVCVFLCHSVGCARSTVTTPQSHFVLIDPGHGGFDGGAVADDGTLEKHLNLSVAICLHDILYVCGVPVALTRTTDSGLEDPLSSSIREKKVSDMRARLHLYNQASLVISIHQNLFSQPQYQGAQLFYSPNHPNSEWLAQSIRGAIIDFIQPKNTRVIKKATDGIYLLYHAQTPAVILECGFLSNPEERELLKSFTYQQQLAFAVTSGYWHYHSTL